jgi:hypothetical protein
VFKYDFITVPHLRLTTPCNVRAIYPVNLKNALVSKLAPFADVHTDFLADVLTDLFDPTHVGYGLASEPNLDTIASGSSVGDYTTNEVDGHAFLLSCGRGRRARLFKCSAGKQENEVEEDAINL